MAALGRLSGGIAHDFNNVMHVIRTCAEFLQRQGAVEPHAGELLQMIKRNADRAAGLSQHLLTVAHRPAASAVPTDVNEVVTDVAQLLRQTLTEDIAVELRLEAGLSWCSIDRNELEAALLNVAADARDVMPGGGTLELATHEAVHGGEAEPAPAPSAGRARRYVVVSISHWRCEDVAHVPGAAVTGDALTAGAAVDEPPLAAEPELRLGLVLTRSLIEQSQGEMHIEPHPRGTTIRLYLPCRAS
jgi:signal transduction histidine kinase